MQILNCERLSVNDVIVISINKRGLRLNAYRTCVNNLRRNVTNIKLIITIL